MLLNATQKATIASSSARVGQAEKVLLTKIEKMERQTERAILGLVARIGSLSESISNKNFDSVKAKEDVNKLLNRTNALLGQPSVCGVARNLTIERYSLVPADVYESGKMNGLEALYDCRKYLQQLQNLNLLLFKVLNIRDTIADMDKLNLKQLKAEVDLALLTNRSELAGIKIRPKLAKELVSLSLTTSHNDCGGTSMTPITLKNVRDLLRDVQAQIKRILEEQPVLNATLPKPPEQVQDVYSSSGF
ncbi:MAG: hypothetical protein AABX38_02800 [Candidatus Micrarchaeota archaeon]